MRGQQYLKFASSPLIGAEMTKQIERFLPPSVLERAKESRRLKRMICKYNAEWNLHFSLRGVGSSSDTNVLAMDFRNLQWAACSNSAADFYPKISALQPSLKIHGATWDQSKYPFSLLYKLFFFFCGTYALHLCISCKYSCPSKGRQPLDSAVELKVWESSLGRPDEWWCDSLLFFFTSQVSVGTWGCPRKGMVCLRCVCSLLRTKLPSLQVFQKWSPDKCFLFIHISFPNNFLFSSFPTLPHTSEQHERKQAVNIGIFYQIFSFFLF